MNLYNRNIERTIKNNLSPTKVSKSANLIIDRAAPTETILDYSCGYGRNTVAMAESNNNVFAYDKSISKYKEYYEAIMKEYINTKFVENLLENNQKFDWILVAFVLNTIKEDWEKVNTLKNIRDHLSDKGKAVIEVRRDVNSKAKVQGWEESDEGWITKDGTYQEQIGAKKLAGLIEQAGLKVAEKQWNNTRSILIVERA